MLIRSLIEFKQLINSHNPIDVNEQQEFIYVTTAKERWEQDLQSALESTKNFYLNICLLVQEENKRLDSIIFGCHVNELTPQFIAKLSSYINNISNDSESILKFLQTQWDKNNKSYPYIFMLTTRFAENYTIICNVGVAPGFRKKGIMKNILLDLVEKLADQFGNNHSINAFTIHPATYLFFNPHDKELKQFDSRDFQECAAYSLLQAHQRKVKKENLSFTSQFFINPKIMQSLKDSGYLMSPKLGH